MKSTQKDKFLDTYMSPVHKKIFPAYIVTFWSLYNLFLHFRKKRLKILKNVLSKNVLESHPQINTSYCLLNFKNRLLLLHICTGIGLPFAD
jgi:hypothetical protein